MPGRGYRVVGALPMANLRTSGPVVEASRRVPVALLLAALAISTKGPFAGHSAGYLPLRGTLCICFGFLYLQGAGHTGSSYYS